jgi:uncharacterized phage infection (PIP) family protein YhgE
MTGTDLCVNKPHKSRSYLNHLVQSNLKTVFYMVLIVISVKTSNSTHTYVFKTSYSIYKFLFYYIPEFWVLLFMLFTAVLS